MWKKCTAIKIIEVISFIDPFLQKILVVSLNGQIKISCVSLVFFAPNQITKINICHMVARKHPKFVEERWQLIVTDILDPEEALADDMVDDDGAASGEEDDSGSEEASVWAQMWFQ